MSGRDFWQYDTPTNSSDRYFRQLQEISDTVMEATWEDSVDTALANIAREQADLQKKIDTGRARQRYLEHLAQSHNEGEVEEEERCCVLCRCEFVRGYITQWCVLDFRTTYISDCTSSVHMYSARYDTLLSSHQLMFQ